MTNEREFEEGVVAVADELVQQHGPQGAIDRLNARRQTESDELRARATEAIAWIRKEVVAEEGAADD
jgi:hypothetical protein